VNELAGKIALVTGSARGIGKEFAVGLAQAGATVVCSGRTPPEATAQAVRDAGGDAHCLQLEVSKPDEVRDAMRFLEGIGGLDILLNNAAIFPRSPVLDLEEEEFDRVLEVNLKGIFLCAQAAGRLMRDQGRGGRIINLTSGAAFLPTAQSAAYASSKAAIVALTRVLALELAPYQITVNALAPGLTDTDQPRGFYSEDDMQAFAARIPLGRVAAAEEMVPAAVFLCSDGAAYVTGHTLHVNGGIFMQ